ncbi:AAA family ATPase [Rhodopirellula sp. P2]|uniref:AAA family ATPase n=1 Tax=Rhodopirellula sp. P2 TaxID=2127060 RepID=UPI0023684331|nr:ATP-binding protein [Rhodopirellula sp. P2]WDQ19090.1 ATP-binding protein [Rhodopirellula sp. P2]
MKRRTPQTVAPQSSESIQKLLLAHFAGNEPEFRAAAWDIIEEERRLNHTVLANELERILKSVNGTTPKMFFHALSTSDGNMPKDPDKNANLVEVTQPDVELDDVVLTPELSQSIERVIQERRSSELLRSHGMQPAGKLLLCGPPGCGKTMVASALANALYLPLATVRFDAVVSSYLGETAANLRKVFEFARLRPVLLFFDEFDAIGKHRTALDEHGELKRVVNSFLQMLDGFHSETLTVAATNHQGLLDPALWRRFDDILLFPNPTVEQIESLLCRCFHQVTVSKSVRLRSVARNMVGFSHADVERVAQDSIKRVLLDEREQVTPAVLNAAVERQEKRVEITDINSGVAVPRKARPRSSKKTS